jgi:hypothetical protein
MLVDPVYHTTIHAWLTGSLAWWKNIQDIKHNRTPEFFFCYFRECIVLVRLYILILYLAKQKIFKRLHGESKYLTANI